jgi:hypothetical protein
MAIDRELPEELDAHVAACETCRETRAIVLWMRQFARTATDERRDLPEASHLWWKARLLQRWAAERRAEAPIEKMRRVEYVAGALGFVLFAMWQRPSFERLLALVDPSRLIDAAASGGGGPVSTVGVVAAIALGVTALIAIRGVVALNSDR